jgi:hypothetical protein
MMCAPSVGVRSPSATAPNTAPAAFAASAADCMGGRLNVTGVSLRGGHIRSRQSLRDVVSPSKAMSTAFCVSASVQEALNGLCRLMTRTLWFAGVALRKLAIRIASVV